MAQRARPGEQGTRAPDASGAGTSGGGFWTWEPRLFYLATALIALHVADDNFLQPQPGTSAADHLLSGLLPLGVLVVAAVFYRWMPVGLRASCALLIGVFGIAISSEAFYYTSKGELGGDDYTGWLSIPAGLLLLGLGAAMLWRSRKQTRNRFLRYARRGVVAVVALAVLVPFVVYPVVSSYIYTHVVHPSVPEPAPDLAYEDVAFTTSDGLRLEGWYVSSENGAAVIVFPGRQKRQDYVRMLADNGYGALIFDRRGEGASEGDPNLLGWGGDRDLKAAIAFLRDRPDVDPERIGGIGLSVGGELLLETAAETDDIQAVVSEGAGARSYREVGELSGGSVVDVAVFAAVSGAAGVFANEPVPPNINDIVGDIAPRSVFFVYGENGQPQEIDLNPTYFESANEPKEIWEVPEAGHIAGLATQPDLYEQRVVGFFDQALLGE